MARLLSLTLAAALAGTMLPADLPTVLAEETAESADVRAVTETWRQFKSTDRNDNGSNAAILVNTNEGTQGMEERRSMSRRSAQ